MPDDPVQYWQDLTENYRQMSDGELLELAAAPEDLTEVARQVLRDEMGKRRLDKPQPSIGAPRSVGVPGKNYDPLAGPLAGSYVIPSDAEDTDDPADEDEPPSEFTWKTALCDCESSDQALQLRAALMRHGIESWAKQVQVYVAADQLEQAQAVAAQPIPQDILDEWNTAVPEFEIPVCPRCGSKEDVMLTSADPVNAWLCEACEAEWTDPDPSLGGDSDTP